METLKPAPAQLAPQDDVCDDMAVMDDDSDECHLVIDDHDDECTDTES